MSGDLDIERPEHLLAYLRAGGRIGPDEVPRMTALPGGVSAGPIRPLARR